MGFMDKLKGLTKGREKQISGAADKAGDMIDKTTKGKHTSHIDTVENKVDEALGVDDDTPGTARPAS